MLQSIGNEKQFRRNTLALSSRNQNTGGTGEKFGLLTKVAQLLIYSF
jgi:hypothetical protein